MMLKNVVPYYSVSCPYDSYVNPALNRDVNWKVRRLEGLRQSCWISRAKNRPSMCVLLRNMKSVQGDCFTFGKELSGAFGVSKCVKLLDPKSVEVQARNYGNAQK
jgi:hypothetical protein